MTEPPETTSGAYGSGERDRGSEGGDRDGEVTTNCAFGDEGSAGCAGTPPSSNTLEGLRRIVGTGRLGSVRGSGVGTGASVPTPRLALRSSIGGRRATERERAWRVGVGDDVLGLVEMSSCAIIVAVEDEGEGDIDDRDSINTFVDRVAPSDSEVSVWLGGGNTNDGSELAGEPATKLGCESDSSSSHRGKATSIFLTLTAADLSVYCIVPVPLLALGLAVDTDGEGAARARLED